MSDLDDRIQRHFADLVRLHGHMDGSLPPDLVLEQQILSAASVGGVREVRLYHVDGFPRLTTSGLALVAMLNEHCQASTFIVLEDHLKAIKRTNPTPLIQNR